MTVLTGTIQKRHGTAAEWAAANPVLLQGEEGLETDSRRTKTGDGSTEWNDLNYDNNESDESRVLTTGQLVTVVTDDVTVAAASYYISGSGSYSSPLTNFNNVALAASGTQRYEIFCGNTSSTVTRVVGSEAAIAVMPSLPANTVLLGYILVTDAAVSQTPDLSGYLPRADKATAAEVVTGTNDTKYITPSGLSGAKDASGGFVGMTLRKINFKNVLGTFTSFFTNSNTAARTYTFQDRDGTIADDTDLALKASISALPTLEKSHSIAFGISAAITLSPADSTDYYFGIPYAAPITPLSATVFSRQLSVLNTGTITVAAFTIWVNSAIGSNENSTLTLEVYSNAAGLVSSNVISSTVKWNDVSRANNYLVTGLSIAVTAGQFILFKLTTPAWATNPTVTWMQGAVFIS